MVSEAIHTMDCFAFILAVMQRKIIMVTDLFGALAVITSLISLCPQIHKAFITKSCRDLSWGMIILFIASAISWLGYGILSNSWPVWLTNGVGLVITIILAGLKFHYDRLDSNKI